MSSRPPTRVDDRATVVAVASAMWRWAAVMVVAGVLVPTRSTAAADPGPESTVAVSSEAEYRDALSALSGDASGPHTIVIEADIELLDGDDPAYTGTQSLTIDGGGHSIGGGGGARLLRFDSTARLRLRDVSLRDGEAEAGGDGGAIEAVGPVELAGVTLFGNTAQGNGGAVHSASSIDVTDSQIDGNRAGAAGGALSVTGGGSVTTTRSTLSDNTATGAGGALASDGDASTLNSTLIANRAAEGGAISAPAGQAFLIYTTLSQNQATEGAHVSAARLRSVTSVFAEATGPACTITGSTTSLGSYETTDTCGLAGPETTVDGPDPELGFLQLNGGNTPTLLPDPTSPLVDAVTCLRPITTDQRGASRPVLAHAPVCDIGAVELTAEERPAEPPPPVPAGPTFTG